MLRSREDAWGDNSRPKPGRGQQGHPHMHHVYMLEVCQAVSAFQRSHHRSPYKEHQQTQLTSTIVTHYRILEILEESEDGGWSCVPHRNRKVPAGDRPAYVEQRDKPGHSPPFWAPLHQSVQAHKSAEIHEQLVG